MHVVFFFLELQQSLVVSSCSSFLNERLIISSSIQPGMWPWQLPFYFCFQNLHKILVKMKNIPFWIQDLLPLVTCLHPPIQNLALNIILKVCFKCNSAHLDKSLILLIIMNIFKLKLKFPKY